MTDDTGVGPGPDETLAVWVKLVVTMGHDELAGLRGAHVQAV